MSSEIDELESVEKILSEVKKNALEVTKDLRLGITGLRNLGAALLFAISFIYYLTIDNVMKSYALVRGLLFASQFAAAMPSIAYLLAAFGMYILWIYGGVGYIVLYLRLRNKYSKLVNLSKELEGQ